MGGVSTVALASAVARAGGLGMLGGAGLPADALAAQVAACGEAGPVGVNLLVPFLDPAALEAAASAAPLVECFYGEPSVEVASVVHAGGALLSWQVGSVDEARGAVDVGCDLVVVQGVEAGGHVRGTTPLLELLQEVRRAVGDDVPLVAAGGIGSSAAVDVALEAGADAVRVGTRLLAAAEADVHPQYVSALIAAGPSDTVLTEAFALGWPDAPHRVLRACVEAGDADPSVRSPLPPSRSFTGDVAAAALYAGTSVGDVTRVQPVAEILDELLGGRAARP